MPLSQLEILLRYDPYNPFASQLKLAIEMYVEKEYKPIVIDTVKVIQTRKKLLPIRKNKPIKNTNRNIKQPTIKYPRRYISCVRK
jgi:hypothetical protein